MKKRKWNLESVKSEIREVSEILGHFPTNSYLRKNGRNDLACQITRRGGFSHLAAEMGIIRKESESDVGWKGEAQLADKLSSLGFQIEGARGVTSPYDILVNDSVRIDAKSANYAEYGACKGWFFRIGKYVQSDIVILHQMDTGDDYVFHWWEVNCTNITISRDGGKYAAFKNDYSKISNAVKAIKSLRNHNCQ